MNASFTMLVLWAGLASAAGAAAQPADGTVVKDVLDVRTGGENLLRPDRWRPFGEGFQRQGDMLICDSGGNGEPPRGACQNVELNQTRPEPILAVAWSEADAAARGKGSSERDYAPYLDLTYDDGTPLYGQAAAFKLGSHDWQRGQLVVLPQRPVKRLTYYLLFRKHSGAARFRDAALQVLRTPLGAATFDGVAVMCKAPPREGFQVRDVAANGPFLRIERQAAGLKLDCRTSRQNGATIFDVTLADATGKDLAATLVYALPVASPGLRWLDDPRQSSPVRPGAEAINATSFHAGLGRLSRWPLAAVADDRQGTALGIDMLHPAFYRLGLQRRHGGAVSGVRHRPDAREAGRAPAVLPLSRSTPQWGFRAALAGFYDVFPEAVPLPHARAGPVDAVCQDQPGEGLGGFRLQIQGRERRDPWDDAHGILTFRYTEPMTWWMPMPKGDAADPRGGRGRGPAAGRQGQTPSPGPAHQRLPRRRRGSSPPGCSTPPGATAPCGA